MIWYMIFIIDNKFVKEYTYLDNILKKWKWKTLYNLIHPEKKNHLKENGNEFCEGKKKLRLKH